MRFFLEPEGLYFIVRYTPFWSIPILVITTEYAYIFWLRNKKIPARILISLSIICTLFTAFYYWAGGPERSVRKVIEVIRYISS
ncbi:MAG: hypothetical protein JNM93_11630 [Bacteriovoracaceae bacterium]|nr:hypothetical protein [Bacteriovoracaceae bacterium]